MQTEPTRTPETRSRPAADDATLLPPVDVIEDAHGITLYADLPGVPREQLDIRIDDDTLTISGELALEAPAGMDANHVEVALPRYARSFSLSRELDRDRIEAAFEQGVLRLRIPKAAHAQPRKIAIQAN